jgi:putative ABC transport system substrate-binding protein
VEFAALARIDEIDAAFTSLLRRGAGALVEAGPNISIHRGEIVALAARQGVPVMYEWPEFVNEGGLISYGTDLAAIWRQAGLYSARILMGEKPGDLPVVEPERYQLVINLKTAKTLDLSIPPSLLARADKVIE